MPKTTLQSFSHEKPTHDIFNGEHSLVQKVLQRQVPPYGCTDLGGRALKLHKSAGLKTPDTASNQDAEDSLFLVSEGLVERPFNYGLVPALYVQNPHHATAIRSKVSATIGMGFQLDENKTKRLDDMCDVSFEDLMSDMLEDFNEYGTGYIEVVRNPQGTVVGLYHLSAIRTWVYLEDQRGMNFHYVVFDTVWEMSIPGVVTGDQVTHSAGLTGGQRFSRYGDKKRMIEAGWSNSKEEGMVSEVIQFRKPSNKSRWYGFPGWLSAIPRVELSNSIIQYQHDFFRNRGVPEFMLFVTGVELESNDWNALKASMQSNVGYGNSHKTTALNIGHPDAAVQIEKLAMDAVADPIQFSKSNETLALEIVSAHGVPPLLAGIQISGKMGAANELPNALMAFQVMVIAPVQRLITKVLNRTLGQDLHGIKFPEPKKISESLDMAKLNAVSRMRETLPEANAKGRPLDQIRR